MVIKYSDQAIILCALISLSCLDAAKAVLPQETPAKSSPSPGKGVPKTAPEGLSPEKLSVTHHSLKINSQTLHYTATAGYIPLKDEKSKVRAKESFGYDRGHETYTDSSSLKRLYGEAAAFFKNPAFSR